MPRIGIWELVVIFLVIIFLFGSKRLPEIGKAIGEAIKEFKKSMKGDGNETTGTKKEDSRGDQG